MDEPDNLDAQGQHYNLRWTYHSNNILQMFADQLAKETLVDCTLACDGHLIKAHKMILCASSPYFENMFQLYAEPRPLIIIHGVQYRILRQVIDFMYRGEIKVAEDDVEALLTIAEALQVKGLDMVKKVNLPASEEKANIEDELLQGMSEPLSEHVETPISPPPEDDQDQEEIASQLTQGRDPLLSHANMNGVYSDYYTVNENDVICVEDRAIDEHGNKIRRPPNAFMLFVKDWRKKLVDDNEGVNSKTITVKLGCFWRMLPAAVKTDYYTAAQKAAEEHKAKYPGYCYNPNLAREKKGLKEFLKKNLEERNLNATEPPKRIPKKRGRKPKQRIALPAINVDPDDPDYINEKLKGLDQASKGIDPPHKRPKRSAAKAQLAESTFFEPSQEDNCDGCQDSLTDPDFTCGLSDVDLANIDVEEILNEKPIDDFNDEIAIRLNEIINGATSIVE